MTAKERVELIHETYAQCGVDQPNCRVCAAFMLYQIERAEEAARVDERAESRKFVEYVFQRAPHERSCPASDHGSVIVECTCIIMKAAAARKADA